MYYIVHFNYTLWHSEMRIYMKNRKEAAEIQKKIDNKYSKMETKRKK